VEARLTEMASAMVNLRLRRLDPRWFVATRFSAIVFFQERDSHRPMRIIGAVRRRLSPAEQIRSVRWRNPRRRTQATSRRGRFRRLHLPNRISMKISTATCAGQTITLRWCTPRRMVA